MCGRGDCRAPVAHHMTRAVHSAPQRSKTRQMLNIPDRSSSRHIQESRAEASAPSPSAPLPPEQSIPQQPSVTANISLSSLFAPPVRGVDVDPAYPDGLQLGLALGLPIHEDVDADGAPVHGDRVARDDVGGMSVVAGVGRRGPAWEQREGLIPGVGSEAGQGRGGVLNAQPEAQPPPMEEYPPPPSSWRPWSAHDPDNVPAIARVAGAGVAAGGSSSQRRLAVSPIHVAAGGAGSGSADVDMGATDGGGAGSAGGDGPPRPATKKQRCGRFIVYVLVVARPCAGGSGNVTLFACGRVQASASWPIWPSHPGQDPLDTGHGCVPCEEPRTVPPPPLRSAGSWPACGVGQAPRGCRA